MPLTSLRASLNSYQTNGQPLNGVGSYPSSNTIAMAWNVWQNVLSTQYLAWGVVQSTLVRTQCLSWQVAVHGTGTTSTLTQSGLYCGDS